MADHNDIHPNAPAGGGGPGSFRSAAPSGANDELDKWMAPGSLGGEPPNPSAMLKINGVIVAGGALSQTTIAAVNEAADKTPSKWRRYIAYSDIVKVGGSLAWRANNPGNLRDASNKIGTTPGASGKFAVFATLEDGRTAQKNLYLAKYGQMTVRDAIWNPKTKTGLTPPSENDTEGYLAQLKKAGVDLDKDVKSQIDAFMKAVEANEGLISGIEVTRTP